MWDVTSWLDRVFTFSNLHQFCFSHFMPGCLFIFSFSFVFFSSLFAFCEYCLKGHIVVCSVPSASQYNEDQVDKQSFLLPA